MFPPAVAHSSQSRYTPVRIEFVLSPVNGHRRDSIFVRPDYAELVVLQGRARWASDGTRRIIEIAMRPRGDFREWRKTVSGTSETGYVHTMQLVPLGRPRGKRSHS